MTLDLDPSSPVPLYQQIVDGVRRLVARGALRPGDRVPPVRDLALQLRINRNTAARAVQELESLGLVRTRVGQGTFIADGVAEAAARSRESLLDDAIDGLLAEAAQLGVPPEELPERVAQRIRQRRRHAKEKS